MILGWKEPITNNIWINMPKIPKNSTLKINKDDIIYVDPNYIFPEFFSDSLNDNNMWVKEPFIEAKCRLYKNQSVDILTKLDTNSVIHIDFTTFIHVGVGEGVELMYSETFEPMEEDYYEDECICEYNTQIPYNSDQYYKLRFESSDKYGYVSILSTSNEVLWHTKTHNTFSYSILHLNKIDNNLFKHVFVYRFVENKPQINIYDDIIEIYNPYKTLKNYQIELSNE